VEADLGISSFTCRLAVSLALGFSAAAEAAPNVQHDRRELEMVMADLIAWFPGAWDSFPQIYYERTVTMPEGGEHEHWHRTFGLIDAPQVGDVVFYGQVNVGGRDGPILGGSQVLYKATIDETRGVVLIRGQGPADPEQFENLHERPDLWRKVRMRDPDGIRCDFVWRRDGAHIVGVLDGRVPERQKYGPGTCTYISPRTDAEFYADAEWVLTPELLWLYDLNTMDGQIFQGREDRTHIRLYRARPYTCTIKDADGKRVVNGHDRGYAMTVRSKDGKALDALLLRADFPTEARGLSDNLRLMLNEPGRVQPIALEDGAALAKRISLTAAGVEIRCAAMAKFAPLKLE